MRASKEELILFILKNHNSIESIKKNGQLIYNKNQFCTPKGENTSCEKLIASTLQLNQEGDICEEDSYI